MKKVDKSKLKKILIGRQFTDGLILKTVIYSLLIGISFIFLYPILFMIITSVKSLEDLLNPTVSWIPTRIAFENYIEAFKLMNMGDRFLDSVKVSVLPTIAILISSSLIGYGLARFDFKGKNVVLVLIVITYIMPKPVTLVPSYILYSQYGLLKSLSALIIPSSLGQGINQSIFILIFYQFFKMTPKVLDEAAQVDGAGPFTVFIRIAIPMAKPAFLVVGLYSIIWHWNELYITERYLQEAYMTLPQVIEQFKSMFENSMPVEDGIDYSQIGLVFNESIQFAATLISITPLVILYLFTQKYFIESIDRTGITGE